MKTNPEKVVVIDVMTCVSGTTTSSEAVSLYLKMKQSLVEGCSIKLSLINATPMSSSFLNASFGELYDQFGYQMIKERITLIEYKPSQAKQIKDYLDTINKLVK
jgi:hypothetical protein